MLPSFLTIEKEVTAEIVEKKSKFIAVIYEVETEEEALQKVDEVRKKHRDARHNVFSYRIANGAERASDDGEPSGTAGVPILDILRGKKLQNVLVVVTRYFGGILLGTGGLVKAYTDSTKQALLKANVIEKKLKVKLEIIVPYANNDKITHFLKTTNVSIVSNTYDEQAHTIVAIDECYKNDFEKTVQELSGRTAKFEIKDSNYYA